MKIHDSEYVEAMERLESRIYQYWLEESYGIMNLAYNGQESTFDIIQDGKVYFGYQNVSGSKIVLVSETEIIIGKPKQEFKFIGCAWFGPNMRISKFDGSINSLEVARGLAEKMLL